jgi:hypothetical protein
MAQHTLSQTKYESGSPDSALQKRVFAGLLWRVLQNACPLRDTKTGSGAERRDFRHRISTKKLIKFAGGFYARRPRRRATKASSNEITRKKRIDVYRKSHCAYVQTHFAAAKHAPLPRQYLLANGKRIATPRKPRCISLCLCFRNIVRAVKNAQQSEREYDQ